MEDKCSRQDIIQGEGLSRECKDWPGTSPMVARLKAWLHEVSKGLNGGEEWLAAQGNTSLISHLAALGSRGLWCENSYLSRILTVL